MTLNTDRLTDCIPVTEYISIFKTTSINIGKVVSEKLYSQEAAGAQLLCPFWGVLAEVPEQLLRLIWVLDARALADLI